VQGSARVNDAVSPITGAKIHMKDSTKRSMVRSVHLVFSIPIIGYIYSPFEVIPNYAPATRFVFLPAMLLSGLWMWKGHVLRRFISKGSADAVAMPRLSKPRDEGEKTA